MAEFFIETALLTHGLVSMGDEDILALWPWQDKKLVWLEEGKICHGTMEEYFPLRRRAKEIKRIDREILAKAIEQKESGCLTASGTMAVAEMLGVPVAVTAGMGGISTYIQGETLCADLPALVESKTILISTSPKDVVDIQSSIEWLLNHQVKILGVRHDYCSGFMFNGKKIYLSGILKKEEVVAPHTLILQDIREEERIEEKDILQQALDAGLKAQERGEYFHPAANVVIDRMSGGVAGRLQLKSLIENGKLAGEIRVEGW